MKNKKKQTETSLTCWFALKSELYTGIHDNLVPLKLMKIVNIFNWIS